VCLQHFYLGLDKDSREKLSIASGGSFLSLSADKAWDTLEILSGHNPQLRKRLKPSEEEKESSATQEVEVTIVKSQPLQSQDLAIHPEPSIPQNLLKEEEILPLEDPCEFKGNIIDFGRSVISRPHKRPPSEPISHFLKEESLRNVPALIKDIGKNSRMACLVTP